MKNEIMVFGSSIKIGAVEFSYFALTIVLSIMYRPIFNITFIHEDALFIIGSIFLIIGQSINAVFTAKMVTGFKDNELAGEELNHAGIKPIHASQIFISVPGVALMLGSWLVLTTTILGLILAELFIRRQ